MTPQEKELIQLIKDCNNTWKHEFKTSREVDLAKSIIARYPQVLAEKVWEGVGECISIDAIEPQDFCSKVIWSNGAGSGLKRVKVYIEVME